MDRDTKSPAGFQAVSDARDGVHNDSPARAIQIEDFASQDSRLHASHSISHLNVRKTDLSPRMTASSTPLGNVNAARRPAIPQAGPVSARGSQLPQDMQAKMRAFHLSRQGAPSTAVQGGSMAEDRSMPESTAQQSMVSSFPTGPPATSISSLNIGGPSGTAVKAIAEKTEAPSSRPSPLNFSSVPCVPKISHVPQMGLAAKRGLNRGMKLSDVSGPLSTSQIKPTDQPDSCDIKPSIEKDNGNSGAEDSLFNKYADYVDTTTGTLKFKGKATIHGKGIDFSSGTSFNISLDEVDTLDELGKGNYGTVYKVRHSRPRLRKPGQGLGVNRNLPLNDDLSERSGHLVNVATCAPQVTLPSSTVTGVVMAMKEIRLELDEAKFAAIIMELDILHRCVSPYIVDFYGAFFQEGAVYICMEFMDGGSIDKLYGDGVPEGVLRKITYATVMGLKSLKDDHNIIHRDVKPTNILINSRGNVKICDFGVSGNLVASIAKTNIGCQSYMAPERISGGGITQAGANPGGGTYSVQSDIWSLGLTVIECALGQYPYPPETYDNIFSQLSAIVDGDPPDLPADTFSAAAADFVKGVLNKTPKLRPTYAMLLRHPWLMPLTKPATITEEDEEDQNLSHSEDLQMGVHDSEVARWVLGALESKRRGKTGKNTKPALHTAPLDAVTNPTAEKIL